MLLDNTLKLTVISHPCFPWKLGLRVSMASSFKVSFTTGREISSKSKNIRLPVELYMWAYLANLWLNPVADVDVSWAAEITTECKKTNHFFRFSRSCNL